MVRRWSQWRNPWDREYAKRGSLWRGSADLGPLVGLARSTRILELGCGDGKFLRALDTAGLEATGLDASRYGLRLARSATMRLVQADVRRLPFQDHTWPAVVARYVIGSMLAGDRDRAAASIARVVAPGGIVVLEEFTRGDFRHGKGDEVEPATYSRNQGILTHYFEPDELRGLFPQDWMEKERAVVRRMQRTGPKQSPRVAVRILLRRP